MSGWHQLSNFAPIRYLCGHCGFKVASASGYTHNSHVLSMYVCPNCDQPTLFQGPDVQIPGAAPGNAVGHLPSSLNDLYNEARNCCRVGAFTSSVLTSRKLLMNIAVTQGATEGLKFIEYVNYLADEGYIPPNGRGWVDHIRKKGNEATHEIALMQHADAEELITFSEMLLRFIYEFPARVPPAT